MAKREKNDEDFRFLENYERDWMCTPGKGAEISRNVLALRISMTVKERDHGKRIEIIWKRQESGRVGEKSKCERVWVKVPVRWIRIPFYFSECHEIYSPWGITSKREIIPTPALKCWREEKKTLPPSPSNKYTPKIKMHIEFISWGLAE